MVGGCAAKKAPDIVALNFEFSREGTVACSSVPPAFTFYNLPADTKVISFHMVDRNVPTFSHGGGKVAYHDSTTIQAGSLSYVGPCPPGGLICNCTDAQQ